MSVSSSPLSAFSRSHPILFLLAGAAIGTAAGSAAFLITELTGVLLFAVVGAIVGFVAAVVFALVHGNVQNVEVTVGAPQIGQAKFVLDAEGRRIAWQLFVETMTRVSTQPLGQEEGFLREALDSLHSLFGTTRELLKEMSPSQVTEGATVEMVAIAMLNKDLRPFLSKWHPLLTAFEDLESQTPEHEWEKNEEFREELGQLRRRILQYAQSFSELAGVSQLDKVTKSTF